MAELQLQPQLQKLGTRKVSFSIMDEARKKNLKDLFNEELKLGAKKF